MAELETISLKVDADTTSAKKAVSDLDKVAKSFGKTLTDSLTDLVVHGQSFDSVLKNMALSLSKMALKAGLAPLQNLFSGAAQSFLSSFTSGFKPFADGGVIQPGSGVKAFANGGVVASPTYFPLGKGTGLAGEAGPEAIIPLRRGTDGKLGVGASNVGGAASSIVVNIQTPNAESFRRSEAQVSSAIAKAVGRARRSN